MLIFSDATKGYGKKKALSNVNVSFEKGKVYALVGPNGSGKSTLMKTAAGLVKLTSGTCTYNGEEIGSKTKSHNAYMSTEPFYYDWMKISDVGKFYSDFFSDFDNAKFDELLRFMELTKELKVKALSSGMAAKLKIAATLSRNADVLMLDEPLNGIDLIGREQIIKSIINATNEEATIIVSSHLFDELEPIVDNTVMLKNGEVILTGNLEDIREKYGKSIVDLYKEIYSTQGEIKL
jgi:ABC-2 type transport system ATP-binding protein